MTSMRSMRSMLSGMERLRDGPDDGGKLAMMALQSKIRELAVPHPDPLAAFLLSLPHGASAKATGRCAESPGIQLRGGPSRHTGDRRAGGPA
jgi:hypothetical protein